MQLKTKFIIFIGAVVIVSYGITFYRTSSFQEELVVAQASRQARMLHSQILLTRKWVADHNGIFLLKEEGVEPNPFLETPEIDVPGGQNLVHRNPAMVTRELSLYAAESGLCSYGVTSLDPINPENAPDSFEARSLKNFQDGVIQEALEIENVGLGRQLRYIAPLYVESSCLECHAYQGYKVGDIRGGLSVTIPMESMFRSIHKNNQMLLFIAILTIIIVAVSLFLLVDLLVVRRIGFLAREMDSFPDDMNAENGTPFFKNQMGSNDEMGHLTSKYQELRQRLIRSSVDLRKTQEQVFQSEKLAALGRLVAGVGHEINNPLGGMLNCVKTMKGAPEDKALHQRYLGLIDKGLGRIKHTVHQLLNFGRMEPLQLKKVSVDDMISECLELLGYGIKHIEFKKQLDLDKKVTIDGEALRQVVMNLSLNAIHAMPDGGVLSIQTWTEGDLIHLQVSDTGTGISKENIQKIFDPFFTTKDVGEGTGLGLSVSYSLIERMGGNITVESKEGKGTSFLVVIPDQRKNFENSEEREIKA